MRGLEDAGSFGLGSDVADPDLVPGPLLLRSDIDTISDRRFTGTQIGAFRGSPDPLRNQ